MSSKGIILLIRKNVFSSERNRFYFFYLLIFLLPLCAFYVFPGKFLFTFLVSITSMSILMRQFEKKMQASVSKLVKMKVEKLGAEQEQEKETFLKEAAREIEILRAKEVLLIEEKEALVREMSTALAHKETLAKEYQQTIVEQRVVIEKSKRMISKLEMKVHDLSYEIKSLLNIDNSSLYALDASTSNNLIPDKKKKKFSIFDLTQKLQKYVTMAEICKSSQSTQFGEFSLNGLNIDHRPLLDALYRESEIPFFLYCLIEEKIVFANCAIKCVGGFSPDRFLKEFPRMITNGKQEWERALARLKNTKEERCRLIMKGSEEISIDCLMASIDKGPFSSHIIGLFSY